MNDTPTLFDLLKATFHGNYVFEEVHHSPAYKSLSLLQ